MTEVSKTRTCKFCAEEIKAAASICPHCGRGVRDIAIKIPDWIGLAFGVIVVFGTMALFGSLLLKLRPGKEFGPFQSQLQVLETTMRFADSESGTHVVIVGNIRNESPVAWKTPQLEAQFFDETGNLIDTFTEIRVKEEILPGDMRGFKIRAVADKPEKMYHTHKVFVRTARDARSWP
jgi:hypothetical protein